jgi:hypothetical protein
MPAQRKNNPKGFTPAYGLPKGLKVKNHIKSQSQSQSQSRSKDRSLRQLLHGIGCIQLEIGRLSGRHREQAHSYNWIGCIQLEIGRLLGRHRWQGSSHTNQQQTASASHHSTG